MNENFSEREIVSLNETFSEFDLQKLEDRLETDHSGCGWFVRFKC